MAETTTTTGTAPAAGGEGQTPQQTNPQPTAPTAEQRTAFQKFWDSLFGGKEEPAPGSGEGTKKDGDPASKEGEGTKQEPQDSKSYSEAELNAKIAEAKAAWEAEQQEKQRLAKLSPEERAKAEGEAQAQELTKLRTELLQRDLKDAAVKKLTDEGFPVGLADLLTYTDKESMEKSLQQTQEVFKSARGQGGEHHERPDCAEHQRRHDVIWPMYLNMRVYSRASWTRPLLSRPLPAGWS